jgi:predicted nuclease of predicted toxin-antitoxin system
MKFLADMGISPQVVQELNKSGHDALHLQDEGLHRLTDGEILAHAKNQGRVLLTHDLDFGELLAAPAINFQASSYFASAICAPQT